MTIRTVYVKAKSKAMLRAALNRVDTDIDCREYHFNGYDTVDIYSLPVGTVVKIFDHTIGGSPYAKAYGNISRDKQGRMIVK